VEDRFLISLAVLSILAETAETAPLLCLIDDAQWLDVPSADALTFAARRIQAEGIVILFAARDDPANPFVAQGLPEVRLTGLEPCSAGTMLAERATHANLERLYRRFFVDEQAHWRYSWFNDSVLERLPILRELLRQSPGHEFT
jgi:hypothetical protein